MNAITRIRGAGETRATIARAVGVSRHAVGFWETGRSMPSRDNLARLIDLAEQHGIVLLAADLVEGSPGADEAAS